MKLPRETYVCPACGEERLLPTGHHSCRCTPNAPYLMVRKAYFDKHIKPKTK